MNMGSESKKEKTHEHMKKAAEVASKSTCGRARCGSIIVKNDEIIGKGYNSPPRNKEENKRCSNSKELYHKKVTDKTCCVHAEQRAIMDSLKRNPDKIQGSILYFARINEKG